MSGLLLNPEPEDRALRRWIAVSFGLHAMLAVAGFIYGFVKPLPPPIETAVVVEFTSPVPPTQARGDQPAPTSNPDPVPAPPDVAPVPPAPTPPRPEPVQPAPPPPPPPPAPPAPASPTPPVPATPPVPVPPRPVTPPPPTPPAPQPPEARPPEPRPVTPPPPPAPSAVTPTPPPPPPPPTPRPPQPTPAQPTPPTPAAPTRPPENALPLPPPPPPPAPPQPQSTPTGTGQTPPVARPEERSTSVQNTLERLRQQQAAQQPPTARPNPAAGRPAPSGGTPQGQDPLSAGDRRAVGERVAECWRVDQGMLGLSDLTVSLRAIVDQAGVIREVRPGPEGVPRDPRARTLYEQARRALLDPACSPLPVPRARLQAVNEFQFNFSPRGFIR